MVIRTRLHVLFEQESKPAAGNALSCKFSQVQENDRAPRNAPAVRDDARVRRRTAASNRARFIAESDTTPGPDGPTEVTRPVIPAGSRSEPFSAKYSRRGAAGLRRKCASMRGCVWVASLNDRLHKQRSRSGFRSQPTPHTRSLSLTASTRGCCIRPTHRCLARPPRPRRL